MPLAGKTMTHGMLSKKGYVVFGVAGCVELLRSCKDRINRRSGQDFESEMSDIEMFHAILYGGFCRCKKLDRPCSFLVPLGFEGRHRCLVVTVPILFVERGRRHDRTRDGTRLNAERRSIVPRPAFADKYRVCLFSSYCFFKTIAFFELSPHIEVH